MLEELTEDKKKKLFEILRSHLTACCEALESEGFAIESLRTKVRIFARGEYYYCIGGPEPPVYFPVTREGKPCIHCGQARDKREPLFFNEYPIYLGKAKGSNSDTIRREAEELGDWLILVKRLQVLNPHNRNKPMDVSIS